MRDIANKADNVDTLSGDEFNSYMKELENGVTKSGITLDPAAGADTSFEMLAQAITRASQGGQTYQDSGVANAYVLTAVGTYKQPSAYIDGMTVMFQVGNLNAGASTVNVSSLGVKDIVNPDGTALSGGEMTLDDYVSIVYDLASDEFRLSIKNSQSVASKAVCKSWCNFNGTGVVTIRDSYNVSSITDNSTGNYTVNLSVTMANANYSVVASNSNGEDIVDTYTTTSFVFKSFDTNGTATDSTYLSTAVFGDLA